VAEPYNILIADDNDDDVSFLLLGFADIQVPVAPTRVRDGHSVLELLNGDRHFHLVVLDYHLPKKNGEEIIRSLPSNGRLPQIVVLSSSLSSEQHRKLWAAGVRKVIEKPPDLTGFALLAASLVTIIANHSPSVSPPGAPNS